MWTKSQQTAIDAECADNIVSAAAGSGKTAVLVERIVGRVLSGKVDIDKLLVVTFTNAAAAELKTRLMNEIMKALDTSPNPDYLNRQLMLINNASICTIDSFCLNVLRSNFYKLGLDPSVKVAEGAEIELLKSDVVNKIIEEHYENEDREFLSIVDTYTGKKDLELEDIVLSFYEFSSSLPGGIDELSKLKDKFQSREVWQKHFVNKAHALSRRAVELYEEIIRYVSFSKETEDNFRSMHCEKNYFENVLSARSYKDVYKAVSCIEFPRLLLHKSLSDSDKEEIKELRNSAKDLYKKLQADFSASPEDIEEDISNTFRTLEKFVELAEEFSSRFTDAKREKSMVDFTDVEHLTLKLLTSSEGTQSDTAIELMNKFEEIYVDEYQDCNGIQAAIFSRISRENCQNPNMFRVGDMKQSIYAFRGSEPIHFKNALARCSYYGEGDAKYNKIILNKNFRSRKNIIDAVNAVFSEIMSEECGEIDYTEDEYLYYNEGVYEDVNPDYKTTDMVFIDCNNESALSGENGEDAFAELKSVEAEAIYVAGRIQQIVDDDNYIVYDKGSKQYRKARYSDIVILLRSGGEKAATFNRILSLASIPVYCEMGEGYYDTPEVVFLTDFLRIIDNPYEDVAMLSVMRHPVVGFSDDDFVSIRLSKPRGTFYSSMMSYIRENNDALSEKVSRFVQELKDYYKKSKYLVTDKLLWDIICRTEYMSYLSFTANHELRKANVKSLLTKAYEFEKSSYKGIFDFIRYIDTIKKSKRDAEPAKILSDDEDVVRIMTIHKSKGLEFPIVFLANATKHFNDMDITQSKILMHNTYGFGLNCYDVNNSYYYELPQKKMLKDIKRAELLSEEMRVLYVALTRAREKLIITGADKRIATFAQKCFDCEKNGRTQDLYHMISGAKSYAEWLVISMVLNGDYSVNSQKRDNLFSLQLINKDELTLKLKERKKFTSFDTSCVDEKTDKKVREILDYAYPYANLADIPSNMSVTELKRREMQDDVFGLYMTTKLTTPAFYNGNLKFTAADIGTFTHLAMEKLDLGAVETEEEVLGQIGRLAEKGFLTSKQAEYINASNICRIFQTELGRKMIEHKDNIKREFSFKYLTDVSDVYPDISSGEKIVVQGMIDVYFEDDDGQIIIADYKTDKVNANTDEIKQRYAPQLKYYKIALEKVLGKKVKKTFLMLLDSGTVEEVN